MTEAKIDNLLLGVGNTLRADDGVGCYIADQLNENPLPDWKAINCSNVPENFTSVIRKLEPKTVVIVDSAEMNIEPGELRIVPKEKFGPLQLTTHAMPLSVLINYIETDIENAVEVIFIGIQPKIIQTDDRLSPEMLTAADKTINILKENKVKTIEVLK